jgi:ATP-dependent Lon protease
MSRDSVFNAASVVRAMSGLDPSDYDLHVNVIGGGNIDGPSAGLAFFLALYSALTKTPLPQDIAVTGEVSLTGNVRAVGGVVEKLYAARSTSMRAFVLPAENARDIEAAPDGITVVPVATIADALVAYGIRPPGVPAARAKGVAR